jgi:hypothetical protein
MQKQTDFAQTASGEAALTQAGTIRFCIGTHGGRNVCQPDQPAPPRNLVLPPYALIPE